MKKYSKRQSHLTKTPSKKSGYNYKLEYKPTPKDNTNQNNKQKNKRKRNITWFNPPYSKHVASNIGKQFLNLLDTCFPPTNKLHKILNRNTVTISYKCMPNMKQIISNHNKTILNKDNNIERKTNNCNCRIKEACPVNQKCQTSSLIYQATVTRHDNNSNNPQQLHMDTKRHTPICGGYGPVVRLLGCHARARRSVPGHCREVPSHVALP